jgi:hypothetical protein
MRIMMRAVEAAGPPPQVLEEIWLAISKFLSETKFLRGLELAALAHWLWDHWVFTFGALGAAVWIFAALSKK